MLVRRCFERFAICYDPENRAAVSGMKSYLSTAIQLFYLIFTQRSTQSIQMFYLITIQRSVLSTDYPTIPPVHFIDTRPSSIRSVFSVLTHKSNNVEKFEAAANLRRDRNGKASSRRSDGDER